MIAQQSQVTVKKLLLTTRGELELTQPQNYLIFCHEHLHPQQEKLTTKPITLQTLAFHRANPRSLENTSITPTLIEHEIHSRLAQSNAKTPSALIVDSSSVGGNQKTPEVFKKYIVLRGYLYTLPSAILNPALTKLSKETQVLISTENVRKQIDYTFAVMGDEQRGFIGEVDAPHHWEQATQLPFYNEAISNVLKCYVEFSSRTACPIFINLLRFGADGFLQQTQSKCSLGSILQFLLPKLSTNPSAYKNILLINPQFAIDCSLNGKTIQYENKSQAQIQQLYKLGFNFAFDLSRYCNQICLTWIAHYLMEWPDQTVISAGLKFKTDFIQFGGQGLLMSRSLKTIASVLGQRQGMILSKVMRENIIRLLSWYEKRIVKVQLKMWKCVKCGKESPETEESFRKFGKDFCTIDCLKAYKF